jgi:hypothetical protein
VLLVVLGAVAWFASRDASDVGRVPLDPASDVGRASRSRPATRTRHDDSPAYAIDVPPAW